MVDLYKDFLRDVEGLNLRLYEDTKGKLTIGYGRNLSDGGIDLEEAEFMLDTDINRAIVDLLDIFPNFFSLPLNLRIVLVSMMFNLGKSRFLTFRKFIEAVRKGDKKI